MNDCLLSVIIINYNTCAMTLECLHTLYADIEGISAEVWVVDNASVDGSLGAILSMFPAVKVIANSENRGFGAANNQAMREATGEFFLLLNSDAFPKQGAIEQLVNYLQGQKQVGVVGPRLLNADGSLQRSCYRLPSPFRAWMENLWISPLLHRQAFCDDYARWTHDQEREVEFVIGACMLVRREVFEQVGGFDEKFFMYAEESDWQRRMQDTGWRVKFLPAAEVTHLGGASGAKEKAKINRYFFDSLDYYTRKHHGLLGLVSMRLAMLIGCSLRTLLWSLVFVVVPRRRAIAASKAQLHSWLCVRQATHWRIIGREA